MYINQNPFDNLKFCQIQSDFVLGKLFIQF